MDELKHRAGEKLEAFHSAAVSVADNGKSRVQDVYNQTSETLQKIREVFQDIWNNELIKDGRAAAAAWSREAIARIKEGAPPLSPVILYEELVALFHDRVWRRSMVIFACGVCLGGGAGLALGLRMGRGPGPRGPHARALHTQPDYSVILVDDHVTSGAGAGEVLVRVQAFSVCPLDRRVLRGRGAGLRPLLLYTHVTVGRGFAGVVLDVGHGVTDLELGDEVWGCVSEWSGGAATELLTIRSSRVSKRPRSLSADCAASLPWCGAVAMTAIHSIRYTPDNCKGKRVAVCGASSGEGCVLLQVLSSWGVAATAVGPHHAAQTLKNMGGSEYLDVPEAGCEWSSLESRASRSGPWDAVLTCSSARVHHQHTLNTTAVLKATAPRGSSVDLRARGLWSDRLPAPLHIIFAATFYTYRILRYCVGLGGHTDWLEDRERLREGLETLAEMVDAGQLASVLDKVYLPQDFEAALAHACGDDAIGTTVIRFP